MKHLAHLATGIAWTLVASCASTPAESATGPDVTRQFERLKALAGEWVTVQEDGTSPAGQRVRYRVSSNGSALVESLFPGTTQEMLTVYYLDRGNLVLTHYCSLGNQPHMQAEPAALDGKLVFECIGGSNFDCASDTHMHRCEFELLDATHVRTTWTLHEHGRPAEVVPFALVRSWQ